MPNQTFIVFKEDNETWIEFRERFHEGLHTTGIAFRGIPVEGLAVIDIFACHGGWTGRTQVSPVTLVGKRQFDLVICCHPFKYVGRLPVLFPEFTGVVRCTLRFYKNQAQLTAWTSPSSHPRPQIQR